MDFTEPCFGIGHNLSLICQMTSEDIKHQLIINIAVVTLKCSETQFNHNSHSTLHTPGWNEVEETGASQRERDCRRAYSVHQDKWIFKAVIFGFISIPNPAFLREKNHSLAYLQCCTHFGGLLAPVLYKIIKKKFGNSVNHSITVLSAHN